MYQIRRPLRLVFVISFVGWENCFCSIFRHTLRVGPHVNLNHGGVSLTKLTCSSDLALVLFHSFFKPNFRHQDLILLSWLPISLNKHVNSGTTVLLFLGRPKEPMTCRLAFQVHVISRLRSYNRARSDTVLPLWVQRWTASCEYIELTVNSTHHIKP